MSHEVTKAGRVCELTSKEWSSPSHIQLFQLAHWTPGTGIPACRAPSLMGVSKQCGQAHNQRAQLRPDCGNTDQGYWPQCRDQNSSRKRWLRT